MPYFPGGTENCAQPNIKTTPAIIININRVIKNLFILYYNNTNIGFLATCTGKGKLKNYLKSITDPAFWILLLCFCVSLTALVFYFLDFNLSDSTLFFLLKIIRYSSFMVCICAFYKLVVKVFNSVKDRKFYLVKILIYLVLIVYGIVIILMESFIIALAGGN